MNKILIVEDNPINQELLKRRLLKRGFDIIVASCGQEAISETKGSAPNLILLDIDLPDINGWEVAKTLKADPKVSGIPIIALTAHAMQGDRERALKAGCDEYETKPVNMDLLCEKIKNLLQVA